MIKHIKCQAGGVAYHLDGKTPILIEQAKVGETYICGQCGELLHVKDGYIREKHFSHLHRKNEEATKRLTLILEKAREGFLSVGEVFTPPSEYEGFKRFTQKPTPLQVTAVHFSQPLTQEDGQVIEGKPFEVLIQTENGKTYAFEFVKPGDSIHPEQMIHYRKDHQVEAVYGVTMNKETGDWEVFTTIWHRRKDWDYIKAFEKAVQDKIHKLERKITRERGITTKETYYYDEEKQWYQRLSTYKDDYQVKIELDDTRYLWLTCRYGVYQHYKADWSKLGEVIPHYKLQAAERKHQEMVKNHPHPLN